MNAHPEIEFAPTEEIEKFQLQKLVELVKYVQLNSPFYQKHFQMHGVDADSFRSFTDLQKIPPITKDDLQSGYENFLCVLPNTINEFTCTSGTLGTPVTVPLTAADLDRLGYNEYISFLCAGCSDNDIFQLMLTLDRQFMAGLAYHLGIEHLGAAAIRTGPGSPAMQWETILRLKPTVIIAVPSFILKLLDYAIEKGIDVNNISVKKAICIGENIRDASFDLNALGKRIGEQWNIELLSTYASTEMQTAFTECEHHAGGHLHPELIYVEVLDENNNAVSEGRHGEITISTFGIEAMPLLRYKTGDIARTHTVTCKCGRSTLRIGPIEGRKQQMIKLKGTTLFPQAIFNVLNDIPEIDNYLVEATRDEFGNDLIRVRFSTVHEHNTVLDKAAQLFQSVLRVVPTMMVEDNETISKTQLMGEQRKARRFLDLRRGVELLR